MTFLKNATSVPWSWKPEWSTTILSNNGLTARDGGQGKAWTTSVALTPIPPGAGIYYYEIRVDVCSVSNSIKIVFGILSSLYLKEMLSRDKGKMGSLKGGCPFGYFPQFGKGTLAYFASGQIYLDSVEVCKTEPFANNDVIGMCVDTTSNTITFYKNHIETPKPPPTPPLTSDPGNACPICGTSLKAIGKDWQTVNKHIDECLTLSLLDNEFGAKPFQITCPYPNCKKPNQLSKDFVPHCNDSHFLENNHSYQCPLCQQNQLSPNRFRIVLKIASPAREQKLRIVLFQTKKMFTIELLSSP
eukprot:gene8474-9966_t